MKVLVEIDLMDTVRDAVLVEVIEAALRHRGWFPTSVEVRDDEDLLHDLLADLGNPYDVPVEP